jgi:hypothetical protein
MFTVLQGQITEETGMTVKIEAPTATVTDVETAHAVLFETLPDLGLDRMTPNKVEFVMCASALTANV